MNIQIRDTVKKQTALKQNSMLVWPFIVACLLSVATLAISSIDFRVSQQSLVPQLLFPASNPEHEGSWAAGLEAKNTLIEPDGLTIWSNEPVNAIVTSKQSWDRNRHGKNQFVLVKARVVKSELPFKDKMHESEKGLDSVLIVRPRATSADTWLHNYLFESLSTELPSQQWETIGRISEQKVRLHAHLLLRSAGAWRLELLEVSSFSLAGRYILAIAAVVVLWLALLGIVVRQLVSGKSWWLQVVSAMSVACVMLGAALSGSVLAPLAPMLTLASDLISVDHLEHVLAHMVLTVGAFVFLGVHCRTVVSVILLNMIVAMFVESIQAHLPHRSANIDDILFAMIGAIVGVAMVVLFSSVQSRLLGKKIATESAA